jgi:hypothetical protein
MLAMRVQDVADIHISSTTADAGSGVTGGAAAGYPKVLF